MRDARLHDRRKIPCWATGQARECIAHSGLLRFGSDGLSGEAMVQEPDGDGNPESRWEQGDSRFILRETIRTIKLIRSHLPSHYALGVHHARSDERAREERFG